MSNQHYAVVGVTFEDRQSILSDFYRTYKVGGKYGVSLEAEPQNPYDPNAISVSLECADGEYRQVGYISKQDNVSLGKALGKVRTARLLSMGPNSKGDIGLNIDVEFDD